MSESRTHKSLLNAKVTTFYFFISLFVSFFSRKIFLEYLGTEFVGLSATLVSVLGFLNITELGVGAAISFTLYKPLQEKNQDEIKKIITILGYIYSKVGHIILGLGVIVSLFFPLIFKDSGVSMGVIYFGFYCYLASSLFGYYINYPSTLFSADQRGYEIDRYSQMALIIKSLIAIAVAKWSGNLYIYMSLEIIFGLVFTFILRWRVKRIYPWLKTDIKSGRSILKEYPSIIVKMKQIFFHKIAFYAQFQLTPILIYAFASLTSVALYLNYTLITSKLTQMVNAILGSTFASVGNLIAEGDTVKIKRIYYEILSLRFAIAGYFTFMSYMLIEPFIEIWLGAAYLLDQSILILLLISAYINFVRSATDQFIAGYGMFHDTWAPLAEVVISVLVSIVGGYLWGISGVILGNVASLVIIICIWKPYFLFKYAFGESVLEYWREFALRALIFLVSVVIAYQLYVRMELISITNFITFALDAAYLSVLFLIVYGPLQYIFDRGARDFIKRILNLIFK